MNMRVFAITALVCLVVLSVPVSASGVWEEVRLQPRSINIDLTLNRNGTVDSVATVKAVVPEGMRLTGDDIVMLGVWIQDNERIDEQSIKIVDLRNDSEYQAVGRLEPEHCLKKFYFNTSTKNIKFCPPITVENDFYYQVSWTYLPAEYFDACQEQRWWSRREINFSFKSVPEPYSVTYRISVGEGLQLETKKYCETDLGWERASSDNWFVCTNDALTSENESISWDFSVPITGAILSYEIAFKNGVKTATNVVVGFIISVFLLLITFYTPFRNWVWNLLGKKKNKIILIFSVSLSVIVYVFITIFW